MCRQLPIQHTHANDCFINGAAFGMPPHEGQKLAEDRLSLSRHECPLWADTVEKLGNNGGLFFCRNPKHSDLCTALSM